MRYIQFIICLFTIGSINAQQNKGNIIIKNATVITITDGIKENTDVLVKNGKISKIGKGLAVGNDVKVVDGKGQYLMPGIIDAHSHIALDVVNEATHPNTADVWVGDALDPYDVGIYRALAGGVTTSHAMHGSANAVGGQCETIKHRYGVYNPDDLRMEGAPRTIKFALGENPMRVHGEGQNIVPATRMGVEQIFRKGFNEALEYRKQWKKFKSGKSKVSPAYNLRMQTMLDIIDSKIIIHCHSYRADEILMLIDVLNDFGVKKICFQHVNEGFKVAPELAEYGAMASVFSDWWAYKFEVYYSTAYNAAILTKNGVITSINSDSGELIRHLYHEAAKSQRYGGLTDLETLKLITINPAKQLGIDDKVGSIEIGKDGDLVLFNNHPLSIYAIPQLTIVDGNVEFDIVNDADDQRIEVDPEEEISETFIEASSHDDRCMQGVFEELFLGETNHSHHNHNH